MSVSRLKFFDKIGFTSRKQIYGFLSVVMSGQIIYAAFEAFKGTYWNSMLEVFGVTNTEMGIVFSLLGMAMFFYVPAGWINNRFSVRSILFWGLGFRFVTMIVVLIFSRIHPYVLIIVAGLWGVLDAIFWPAVVNGTALLSGKHNKGIAFGLLESLRRLTEVGMNALIALAMFALGASVFLFQGAMVLYTLAILPMMFCVWKFVPNDTVTFKEGENKEVVAFKNLVRVLLIPRLWLAGLAALATYWAYIISIFAVVYMQTVFKITTAQTAVFGIVSTGVMGIFAGIIAGGLADFVFKGASKMMALALTVSCIAVGLVLLLPKDPGMIYINIVLLLVYSFSIFLSRGVLLAPVAEAGIPKNSSGAAMSVGSFLAYAPVLWAYALNGWIIDNFEPIQAYENIFSIGVVVSLVGAICAWLLTFRMRKIVNEGV